jgi:hypothetical protein
MTYRPRGTRPGWRRLAVAAALLTGLLAGGDWLLWHWAVGQIEHGLNRQVAQWRARGWRVAAGAPLRGGWPLHARVTVPQVTLAGAAGSDGFAWSAPRLVLDVALLHPRRLVVEIAGEQHLLLGAGPAVPVRAEQARVVIPLAPGTPPQRFDLTLTGLQAGPPGAQLLAGHATLALAELPAASGPPVLAVALDAGAVTLPPAPGGAAWALGAEIASLSVAAEVTGTLPVTGDPAALARAWRDGGGRLDVRRLALRWGPLGLDGSVALMFDQALQPAGSAQLRLTGQAATLDALAAGGVLTPQAARAAKAVLALMAHAPKPGEAPEVDVPLELHGQVLTMGRIPLLRLPKLVWPTTP